MTKLGCFDLYLAENNVFPFSFLNYAVFCFMALETCFHSFAVKFCCFNVMAPKKGFLFSVARLYCLRRCRTGKKVFFLFAANHTNFFSILVKTNWRPNHAVFSFNAPEACFGLLCVKSRCFRLFSWKRFLYFAIKSCCFEPYLEHNKIFPFLLLNHAVWALSHNKICLVRFRCFHLYVMLYVSMPFRFILTKSAFSLIGLSLGFFYCFRTKKTFSACLQLITLMLAYFTQNNVIVCLQLN